MNHTLNILRQDDFLMTMLQKHRLDITKDQLIFCKTQIIQAQKLFKEFYRKQLGITK